MSRIKGKNTKPEMLVRKFLHANGYRYRLHDKKLPGKPDIVLPKYKTVIFVHGCFWHGHKDCKYFVVPKTRTEWWLNKINGNIANDVKPLKALRKKVCFSLQSIHCLIFFCKGEFLCLDLVTITVLFVTLFQNTNNDVQLCPVFQIYTNFNTPDYSLTQKGLHYLKSLYTPT